MNSYKITAMALNRLLQVEKRQGRPMETQQKNYCYESDWRTAKKVEMERNFWDGPKCPWHR